MGPEFGPDPTPLGSTIQDAHPIFFSSLLPSPLLIVLDIQVFFPHLPFNKLRMSIIVLWELFEVLGNY